MISNEAPLTRKQRRIEKKRMKALYSPLEEQKSSKKVLKFIKNRSNMSKFYNYYKT